MRVRLEGEAREVRATVEDDGQGLAQAREGGHHGLGLMEARVRELGGHLAIGPGDGGRGTRVEARIPLHGDERDDDGARTTAGGG